MYSLKFITAFILICFVSLLPMYLTTLSDANAQSPEQIEMAKQLGIDIEDFKINNQDYETGLGQINEEFVFDPQEKEEKEDLKKYLGFREDLGRFGDQLFSNVREEFQIADDAQATEDYLLGLGDQLLIQYYGAVADEFKLEIDRSGAILLPKIGPVILNGLKLSEAKDLINNRISTQLVGVNAAVSLGKTKYINVFVAGSVVAPGVYSMPGMSRVTHALYLAGGISDLGSYRNIQVKRQGKLVGSVDLYDFLVYGDNSSDINLKPNDVIFVDVAEINLQVTGAVKRPGVFELKGEETLKELFKIFGGSAPGADIENVIYSSLSNAAPTQIIDFSNNDKFKFLDGDSIFVKFKPTSLERINNNTKVNQQSSAVRVNIQGEVNFPGTYLLQSGDKLSDLVERAGGMTESAFVDGAIFTRETVRNQEAFRARELAEQVRRQVVSSSQTQSKNRLVIKDVEFITEQLENYTGIGRVIIDMPRALAKRSDADLILTNGDAVFIPTKSNTVTVFGEVRRQSSFVYNSKYEIDDYLTMAAGITQLADENNIYVVKANGNIEIPSGGWFQFGSSKIINEGDTIIVPVDYQYRQSLPFWRDVISIVYQGAVAVAAINGL